MIHEACQLKPVIINETIEIRSEYCGKIIGKGGENLRTIKEFSGTRVHISKEAYRGDDDIRLCTIEGIAKYKNMATGKRSSRTVKNFLLYCSKNTKYVIFNNLRITY